MDWMILIRTERARAAYMFDDTREIQHPASMLFAEAEAGA